MASPGPALPTASREWPVPAGPSQARHDVIAYSTQRWRLADPEATARICWRLVRSVWNEALHKITRLLRPVTGSAGPCHILCA